MQASRPRWNKPADRLTGLEIALQDLAARTIGGSGIAEHTSSVGRHPQIAPAHGDAAGVVRFGIEFMEHLSGPVHQVGPLRYLLGNPQTLSGVLQAIGVPFG
jgi:hypothetical protein